MQLSRYLKIYPDERNDQCLLFSTRQCSKALLHKDVVGELTKGNGGLPEEQIALLKKLGMVVDDAQQEKQGVMQAFESANARNTLLRVTAVMTLACNFACPYCFEGEMKGGHFLSDETAAQLTAFVKQQFSGNKKMLHMTFYGGEPLLCKDNIVSISEELAAFVESRGGTYSFGMVSNGALFTRRIAEELAPLGLEKIQITLDGPKDLHDTTRLFTNGAGSFDLLIKNIKATCDMLKISIVGNYDRDNYKRFPELLDHLLQEGIGPDKVAGVRFSPVVKRPRGVLAETACNEGCVSSGEPWLEEAQTYLHNEIVRRGYATTKVIPVTCLIEIRDSYIVNYNGELYKCPGFVGKEGFSIGNVASGIRDYTDQYRVGFWKKDPACEDCEYLPLCFGGCRYLSLVRDDTLGRPDCKKDFYDNCLEGLLKQEIEYS